MKASGLAKVLSPPLNRRGKAPSGGNRRGAARCYRTALLLGARNSARVALGRPFQGSKSVAMSSPVLSILSAAAAGGDSPPAWSGVLPLVAMIAVFWFLIIRPQMKRQKEHQTKVAGLKKGDQVLTGGGLLAKVIKVDEHYAELELGPNMRVKALKSTIADVVPPAGTAPAND